MSSWVRVFICVNKKIKGKSCALFDAESVYEYLRQEFNSKRHLFKGIENIKVVKTSCLGHCEKGPNIFISPDNMWYTFACIEDIDELIRERFIYGKKAYRLINKEILV